jgi:hypothetical protein
MLLARRKGHSMAWTWAKRTIEQNITGVMKAPQLYAYGSILWAFFAGFELREVILSVRNHSADTFEYLTCPLLLLVALLWTYFVVRAMQRFQTNPAINYILED